MKFETPILIPARIINEYAYCPRLAWLEWVQGEWAESVDTIKGAWVHRRVDEPGRFPDEAELKALNGKKVRSVTMSDDELGVISKVDLLELHDDRVVPVEYKKGKRPHVAKGAWESDLVQLCCQGLILRSNGYPCDEGVIYFAGSKERVKVAFDDDLISQTQRIINNLHQMQKPGAMIPEPLENSERCPKCALVSICLPDEITFLKTEKLAPRPIVPRCEDAFPLYVQEPGAFIRKKGGVLEIRKNNEKLGEARLEEISQVALFGPVGISTPTIHELVQRGVSVNYHSSGGWFIGRTDGPWHKNVELRTFQYQKSFDPEACLSLARSFVQAKIANCRTLLRRNRRDKGNNECLDRLNRFKLKAKNTASLEILLGIEGSAAAIYFGRFQNMISRGQGDVDFQFDFSGRNRRPPKDPVNTLLSFAYAMLTREWTNTLATVGFDPYRGFYHQPRFGRPALALDMMESFRPIVADSTVITAINNGEIKCSDFHRTPLGCTLTKTGKRQFIQTFERRLTQEIIHPIFGYKISYRRIFEVQARLLARFLSGEIGRYPDFTTR